MNALPFALLVMLSWAFFVVVFSRVKYGLALLAGVGCYIGAFMLGHELGAAAVAGAWAIMAAIGAIVTAIEERMPIPSTIATFIVGLLAWPLVFPGIKTPSTAPSVTRSETSASDVREADASDDDDDDDSDVVPSSPAIVLADRSGNARASVAFSSPLSIMLGETDLHAIPVRGITFARATDNAPATLRTTGGDEVTWDERAGARWRLSDYETCGGSFLLLDRNGAVVRNVAHTRLPALCRDEWYALAAAFGRLYEGAVIVEDSLAGLDA